MARLIIGHVTEQTATLWVRGDARHPYAFVNVGPGGRSAVVTLEARHGFTGVATFSGLQPNTDYNCNVEFGSNANTPEWQRVDFGHCRGQFKTAPKVGANGKFSFLLGSCNLHSLGIISSPDRAYEELLSRANEANANFMIHCGDQIYYDIPVWFQGPDIEDYRKKYLDAWSDCRPARKFLTQLPHYMIMDDHEITNNFAMDMCPPDGRTSPEVYRTISMKAYREFVQIRQPGSFGSQALYYTFSYGDVQFFVLDCRTERYGQRKSGTQMVSNRQLAALKDWLVEHSGSLKFVVSSVPFVTEVANDDDKWASEPFLKQREELIDHITANNIDHLVFLTGDMHASYHARMSINGNVRIHELMSSPINQLSKSGRDRFAEGVPRETSGSNKYKSRITKFFSDNSNAMVITVDQGEVSYKIFRTKKSRIVKTGSFTP